MRGFHRGVAPPKTTQQKRCPTLEMVVQPTYGGDMTRTLPIGGGAFSTLRAITFGAHLSAKWCPPAANCSSNQSWYSQIRPNIATHSYMNLVLSCVIHHESCSNLLLNIPPIGHRLPGVVEKGASLSGAIRTGQQRKWRLDLDRWKQYDLWDWCLDENDIYIYT